MRVLSLGATQLYVTYALPIAIAACIAVVALSSNRPGTGELSTAMMIGGAFWIGGCLVQVISHLAVWGAWGEPCESVTVGLLGVEFPPLHLTPRRLLGLSLITVAPLILAGITCIAVGINVAGETPWLSVQPWQFPSLGRSPADALWQSGGVLLMVQWLCQAFPLPRTPGRQMILAAIAASLRHLDLPRIVSVARRTFVAMALMTSLLAIVLLPLEVGSAVQRWPILFFVAVVLWVSSRSDDVHKTLWSLVNAESATRGPARISGFARLCRGIQLASGRRRTRKALLRERREAADASRLDEILARLHEQGESSLSSDDRAILRRVSESLRTHRRESDRSELKP